MAKQIIMQFDAFGNSKLDAEGFQGSSCKDATKNYLLALGAKSKDDREKPEFSMPNPTGNTQSTRW
jgi:hypothetical protein